MIKHKSRFAEERPRAVVHAAERLQLIENVAFFEKQKNWSKHAENESLHLAESSRQGREMIKHKSRFAEERPRAVVHAAERLQQASQCFASAVSPTCMNEDDYLLCL